MLAALLAAAVPSPTLSAGSTSFAAAAAESLIPSQNHCEHAIVYMGQRLYVEAHTLTVSALLHGEEPSEVHRAENGLRRPQGLLEKGAHVRAREALASPVSAPSRGRRLAPAEAPITRGAAHGSRPRRWAVSEGAQKRPPAGRGALRHEGA